MFHHLHSNNATENRRLFLLVPYHKSKRWSAWNEIIQNLAVLLFNENFNNGFAFKKLLKRILKNVKKLHTINMPYWWPSIMLWLRLNKVDVGVGLVLACSSVRSFARLLILYLGLSIHYIRMFFMLFINDFDWVNNSPLNLISIIHLYFPYLLSVSIHKQQQQQHNICTYVVHTILTILVLLRLLIHFPWCTKPERVKGNGRDFDWRKVIIMTRYCISKASKVVTLDINMNGKNKKKSDKNRYATSFVSIFKKKS